jgi:hypothetical protein
LHVKRPCDYLKLEESTPVFSTGVNNRISDLYGRTCGGLNAGASFGPTEPALASLFRPTMEWLLGERYVTGKTNGAGHFALIALTEKGCSVLRQIPRSVAPEPSVPQNKPLGGDNSVDGFTSFFHVVIVLIDS